MMKGKRFTEEQFVFDLPLRDDEIDDGVVAQTTVHIADATDGGVTLGCKGMVGITRPLRYREGADAHDA